MRNVSDKTCRKNRNTHFVFDNPPPENRSVYTWKNIVKMDRPQPVNFMLDTQGYKHTLRICGTIFTASPLQQWMHECASVSCYACIACLVSIYIEINIEQTKNYKLYLTLPGQN